MNTWAVFWYASVFLNNGLSLHPAQSLTHNIGHDGSGINCGHEENFSVNIKDGPITYFERDYVVNISANKRLEIFFKKTTPTIWQRIYNRIKTISKYK